MGEKQEGYNPSMNKTEKESPVVEIEMPSIDELSALLNESEKVVAVAAMSGKEIDDMIEKRQKSIERFQDIETIKEKRLQKVENFNTFKDLKSNDYERLVQEEVIDEKYAESLKKIDETIVKLKSLEYLTTDANAKLEELSEVQNRIQERIKSQIEEKQQEIATRSEKIKNKITEHYLKRSEDLEQTIAAIESNPRVMEKLQTMAEKEMGDFFKKRETEKQQSRERIEKEQKRIIDEATRFIQSLGMRHSNAFKRIGELVDNEKTADELMQTLKEKDIHKQQDIFNRVQNSLITAIIDGEGEKQLKDLKEIVPWKIGATSIRYWDAINFLKDPAMIETLKSITNTGNEQAKKIFEQCKQIIDENEVIRRLTGKEWITDFKSNQKRPGKLRAAFDTRIKNDEDGITLSRKKEREEIKKQEEEFMKLAEDIIKRGGFVVEVPIIKEIRGKKETVGRDKGAILLEKQKSPKGNEYWKVVEIIGAKDGLKVGASSPLDMGAFPQWLRESARPYFVKNISNNDFTERLTYES